MFLSGPITSNLTPPRVTPICRYGSLHPAEEIKAKYAVKAETSLQELSTKALLKPVDGRYYDFRSTYPIYRCACVKFHWGSTCGQLSIYEFISCLPRSEKRIPDNIKEYILGVAKKMCKIHEVKCECFPCLMERMQMDESDCSTCGYSGGEDEEEFQMSKEDKKFTHKFTKMLANF